MFGRLSAYFKRKACSQSLSDYRMALQAHDRGLAQIKALEEMICLCDKAPEEVAETFSLFMHRLHREQKCLERLNMELQTLKDPSVGEDEQMIQERTERTIYEVFCRVLGVFIRQMRETLLVRYAEAKVYRKNEEKTQARALYCCCVSAYALYGALGLSRGVMAVLSPKKVLGALVDLHELSPDNFYDFAERLLQEKGLKDDMSISRERRHIMRLLSQADDWVNNTKPPGRYSPTPVFEQIMAVVQREKDAL